MDYICTDCPRRCGVLRTENSSSGLCASPALPRVARAAAHLGEEPCISGERGSGTIFFTGCTGVMDTLFPEATPEPAPEGNENTPTP